MYPTLFKIGDIAVSSFSVMVLIAFLVAYQVGMSEAKRRGGISQNLFDLLFASTVIGGLIGAKILFLIQNTTFSEFIADPLRFMASGLTFHGGLLGAFALIGLIVWKGRVNFWLVTDIVSPALIIAYAIGRVGCFLAGDDYGTPSDLPWAMAFPEGSPPTTDRVHPTQIYTTLIMLCAFAFLWGIRGKDLPVGWLSAVTLLILGVERFFMEFIRNTTPSLIPGISQAQLISIGLIAVGVFKLVRLKIGTHKPAELRS
ncbi:MAG TPA: prolipoprotein diacylglyceryl transferase [Thermodesulfobacteriota bacterium]|nr:prolipoprotein diacylglyceryl transferase [Thermodesulfobacteriota bacterium]